MTKCKVIALANQKGGKRTIASTVSNTSLYEIIPL